MKAGKPYRAKAVGVDVWSLMTEPYTQDETEVEFDSALDEAAQQHARNVHNYIVEEAVSSLTTQRAGTRTFFEVFDGLQQVQAVFDGRNEFGFLRGINGMWLLGIIPSEEELLNIGQGCNAPGAIKIVYNNIQQILPAMFNLSQIPILILPTHMMFR